jgi:L-2-hydroxyglutarate oxidase LhgO
MIPDYLVVGAGVIGLSVAREIKRRDPASRVTVIDQEAAVGVHASGRNSGVLHAGFYYSPDSLKARFTRIGNERLTEYCLERNLPINRCGKLVLATAEDELPGLDELYRRGLANGVKVEMIDAAAAREIEPRAKVHHRAIWSPTTSTIDPHALMESLLSDARGQGIDVQLGTPYRGQQAGFVINAAGLGAVSIARRLGFARRFRMMPFKGLYLYSDEPPGSLRTHLYPVPDPRFPFLGVHFTVTVDGLVKIGPTARPSILHGALLLATNATLRAQAFEEILKTLRPHIVKRASVLAEIDGARYRRWGKPGVRAQLYDIEKRELEMDFVLEGDRRSMHILNVVSPGLTCALSFAEYVVDQLEERVSRPLQPAPETRLR